MLKLSFLAFLLFQSLLFANEQMKKNKEFDKNLSYNLQKISELNEQSTKTYHDFISKINARVDNKKRTHFEASEKKFIETVDDFLMKKYGAMNLANNPLKFLCWTKDQENWRAYRIKFLGDMIDPKTGFVSPCHQGLEDLIGEAKKNTTLLAALTDRTNNLHHHFLQYLDQTTLFIGNNTKSSTNCSLKQKNISLNFYVELLKEWELQKKEKNICLQK